MSPGQAGTSKVREPSLTQPFRQPHSLCGFGIGIDRCIAMQCGRIFETVRLTAALLVGAVGLVSPDIVHAQRTDVPSGERARNAEQVVVGHVSSVTAVWRDTDYGDRLIFSVLHVAVDETLKGAAQPSVDVEVEGGTIGSLTLRVSDLETFRPGDRAIFYLQHNRRGAWVPHLRGVGLQRVDAAGRVAGTTATLEQVRRDVRAGASR
jgi:hypothetical protein